MLNFFIVYCWSHRHNGYDAFMIDHLSLYERQKWLLRSLAFVWASEVINNDHLWHIQWSFLIPMKGSMITMITFDSYEKINDCFFTTHWYFNTMKDKSQIFNRHRIFYRSVCLTSSLESYLPLILKFRYLDLVKLLDYFLRYAAPLPKHLFLT